MLFKLFIPVLHLVHYLSAKNFHCIKPLIGYRPNITIIDTSNNSFTEKVP